MGMTTVREITVSEAWDRLCQNQASQLIDVRTLSEWQSLGFPDLKEADKEAYKISVVDESFNLNPSYVADFEKLGFSKDQELFFICKAGGRSLKAAIIASELGYTNVYNLYEGYEGNPIGENGWLKAKLPVRFDV